MPNLPITYHIQDGCHNCRYHWMSPREQLFCALQRTMPVMPRVADFGPKKWNALARADKKYANAVKELTGREVDPAGICDQHERRAE